MICMQADWDPHLLLTPLPGHSPAQRSGNISPAIRLMNTDTDLLQRLRIRAVIVTWPGCVIIIIWSPSSESKIVITVSASELCRWEIRDGGSRAQPASGDLHLKQISVIYCGETWFTRGLGRARLMRDWIVAAINQHYSRPGSWY